MNSIQNKDSINQNNATAVLVHTRDFMTVENTTFYVIVAGTLITQGFTGNTTTALDSGTFCSIRFDKCLPQRVFAQ